MTNILIGLHFPARRWRDLGIADFTVVLRVFIQQRFIRQEAFRQPFGIIQTLYREDILHVLEFILKLGQLRRQRARGLFRNFVGFNTNRIDLGVEGFAPRRMGFAAVGYQARFA